MPSIHLIIGVSRPKLAMALVSDEGERHQLDIAVRGHHVSGHYYFQLESRSVTHPHSHGCTTRSETRVPVLKSPTNYGSVHFNLHTFGV